MDEDEEDDLDTDSNMHNALMAIGAGLNSEGMLLLLLFCYILLLPFC